MFNVGDWTQAEAQLCGANLEIGKTVAVSVYVSFDGEDWIENFYLVTIGSLDDMPPLT
jgi:hypothetical protein